MAVFKTLTKAEEQLMQVLWKIGKGTTKDIIEYMPVPRPHYNTASTILKILSEKGFVQIDAIGKSNFYSPAVSKESYSRKSAQQLVKGYFGGSFANMLSFFAKEKDISISELEQIIKELKK
jgi:BlaI family transcriptional regulator, penicillinase repressor